MALSRNRQTLENAFAATAAGDGRAFVAALADDVTWSIIGSTAWSRTFEGRSAVVDELLTELAAQFEGPNVVSGIVIAEDGETLVVEGRNHSRTRRGTPYPNRYCWIMKMRDGQISRVTEYADTLLISEALDPPRGAAR